MRPQQVCVLKYVQEREVLVKVKIRLSESAFCRNSVQPKNTKISADCRELMKILTLSQNRYRILIMHRIARLVH